MFLPTPTCPKWINPFHLSPQIKQICGVESINLYEPSWAVPVFAISLSAGVICLLGALALWRIKALNNSTASDKRILIYQFTLAGLTLVLYGAIFVFMPVIAGWIPGPTLLIFN
jgi:predicted small integral membrane protein